MLNITESMGKGSKEVGIGLMIAAMVELPVMYFIVYLNKKLGYVNLFRIFSISFVIKILITIISVLTNSISLFYIAQFTQSGKENAEADARESGVFEQSNEVAKKIITELLNTTKEIKEKLLKIFRGEASYEIS